MLYETARLLAYQSYQHWISHEFLSFGWFFTMGVIIVVYAIWFKLVDRSRLRDFIVLGSLSAIGFILADMILQGSLGVDEFIIRPVPLVPAIFIISITKGPILFMIAQQYTSSWKSYTMWVAVMSAVLAFGLFPLYSLIGIYQLHKWNYFYQFLLMFTDGIIARGLLLWVISLEHSKAASEQVHQRFSGLQTAATKQFDEDNDVKEENQ